MSINNNNINILYSLLEGVSREDVIILLKNCKGDIELAANRFFQSKGTILSTLKNQLNSSKRSSSDTFTQPAKIPKSSIPTAAVSQIKSSHLKSTQLNPFSLSNQSNFIGEFVVIAFATNSGQGLVKPGDTIQLKRDISVNLRYTRINRGRGNRGILQGKKDNTIIRFFVGQSEIGRLPGAESKWLTPLMDRGLVSIKGTCVDAPYSLVVMDNIILQLQVYLANQSGSSHNKDSPLDNDYQQSKIDPRWAMKCLLDRLALTANERSSILENHSGSVCDIIGDINQEKEMEIDRKSELSTNQCGPLNSDTLLNPKESMKATENLDSLITRYQQHMESLGPRGHLESHSRKIPPTIKGNHIRNTRTTQQSTCNMSFALQVIEGIKAGKIKKEECPICLDTPENLVVTPCLHMGCRACLASIIPQLGSCPVCRCPMTIGQLMDVPAEPIESESCKTSTLCSHSGLA